MIYSLSGLLLLTAFVLAILDLYRLSAILLILVGLIDIIVIYLYGWLSISNWVRKLTPYSIDIVILVGLVPTVLFLCGLKICVWYTLGLLSAHFFNIQNSRR